jgi:hypothetical protein
MKKTYSVAHEMIRETPKSGVRAYARTPDFGVSFNFRKVLILTPHITPLPGKKDAE